MVKNDREVLEIPALSSCEWGIPKQDNSKRNTSFEFFFCLISRKQQFL